MPNGIRVITVPAQAGSKGSRESLLPLYDALIDWSKIQACTAQERESLLPFYEALMKVGRDGRQEGLPGIQQHISNPLFDDFDKLALQLIVNSMVGELSQSALYHLISSVDLPNVKYLEYTMMMELVKYFMVLGQTADLRELQVMLRTYLGPDYIQLMDNWDFETIQKPK